MSLSIVPISFAEACAFVCGASPASRCAPPAASSALPLLIPTRSPRTPRRSHRCGVAIVGRPVARALDDGWTLEVNRLCTDGTSNACSMLYAAALARGARARPQEIDYLHAARRGRRIATRSRLAPHWRGWRRHLALPQSTPRRRASNAAEAALEASNYYERHIGDYIRDTVGLSMLAMARMAACSISFTRPRSRCRWIGRVYRMARATSAYGTQGRRLRGRQVLEAHR
ncbi:XF1762 family protein [Cupriavidus basilensis]